jgi:phosphoribosylformylglycinamidine synthase
MQDLILNKFELTDFKAFVACGGFSYGDVLGAGEGWSKVILNNTKIKDQFESFFNKPDTIALGVCNGCQMMSNLKKIIPGTEYLPKFVKNVSDQFESRVVTVKIPRTNSIFFKDMYDSYIPVITAHGEGRAIFDDSNYINNLTKNEQITLQYVNNSHKVTSTFPFNPNGSPEGVTGLSCEDGRFNIMMPHPERVFRTDQQTWNRYNSKNFSAWHKIFLNAHYFLNNS